jgi:small-conductance mechanosensitive channel
MTTTITSPFTSLLSDVVIFIPKLLFGLVLLLVGLLIASLLKKAVYGLFEIIRPEKMLGKEEEEKKNTISIWKDLFAELVRWTTIIVFLVPTVEIWGIPNITEVLNKLLLYIPNVFIAAIIGLVGTVLAHFTSDIIRHGGFALGATSSKFIGNVSYYAILIFTMLIALNQLGIASDLIRILFTGFVAMIALAGGLAFGLGGQEVARDVLKSLQKKLK